jgi:ATP-dependent Lhr-like helicase
LKLDCAGVTFALAQLEGEGLVLRGRFRPGAVGEEFCDRRILARIHRGTMGRLRREIEPVSQTTLMRFLLRWQRLDPATAAVGEGGLLDIIEQLQGFEVAAGVVESEVIAPRMQDYKPDLLDRLSMGGEVVWGCMSRQIANGSGARSPLTRATPVTLGLRECLDWLLGPVQLEGDAGSGAAAEVLSVLSQRGACFTSDIISLTRRLPSDVEEALWLLAAQGRATCDSLQPLRRRVNGQPGRNRNGAPDGSRSSRRRHTPSRRLDPRRREAHSRWSILEPLDPATDAIEMRVTQLLRRYGVVFPEILARESAGPSWRDAVRVLRRLEARGEIRGGRFVTGFVGEQFGLPEAVDSLREVNRNEPNGSMVAVSACDPLNLVGILTAGDRVPAVPGNRVVFRDGIPVASLEAGKLVIRAVPDAPDTEQVRSLLQLPQLRPLAA